MLLDRFLNKWIRKWPLKAVALSDWVTVVVSFCRTWLKKMRSRPSLYDKIVVVRVLFPTFIVRILKNDNSDDVMAVI